MKKTIQTIWFVVRGYPTKDNSSFAFLQPVIREFADRGIICKVFAPQSINGKSKPGRTRPEEWEDVTEKGNKITIYQPKYISLPDIMIGGVQINIQQREKALKRALRKQKDQPDLIYAHFWDCAMIASTFCQNSNIPLVVVCGESKVDINRYYSNKILKDKLKAVKAVICVSSKNRNECLKLGLIDNSTNVIISPNAIDTSLFYQIERSAVRKELNIDDSNFIVSYVGRYSDRKGVNRLIEAVKQDQDIKLILIGYGGELHESNQILIARRVAHEEVVKYLNASDVYCLPTLAEGCCNSIVEAMACGLPIVSSDLEFNDDILDETNSIRVDSSNISDITNAITILKDNEHLRIEMGAKSLEKARNMTLKGRINTLIDFIQNTI